MYETPEWAAKAILDVEMLTEDTIDPCCGRGVLAEAAEQMVMSYDLHDWGYGVTGGNFLETDDDLSDCTIFMNPPFSLAEDFVRHCFKLNARKIICFQRFAWWESHRRQAFWSEFPPNRVYVCAKRATCWRLDIPMDQRKSGSTTAHAWFVWERGHPKGTVLGSIS